MLYNNKMQNRKIHELKGLGKVSAKCLKEIGILSEQDLRKIGPVQAFLKLQRKCSVRPSLNFLYAMIGALRDEHWTQINREEKAKLLRELEDYAELEQFLLKENQRKV